MNHYQLSLKVILFRFYLIYTDESPKIKIGLKTSIKNLPIIKPPPLIPLRGSSDGRPREESHIAPVRDEVSREEPPIVPTRDDTPINTYDTIEASITVREEPVVPARDTPRDTPPVVPTRENAPVIPQRELPKPKPVAKPVSTVPKQVIKQSSKARELPTSPKELPATPKEIPSTPKEELQTPREEPTVESGANEATSEDTVPLSPRSTDNDHSKEDNIKDAQLKPLPKPVGRQSSLKKIQALVPTPPPKPKN